MNYYNVVSTSNDLEDVSTHINIVNSELGT